MARETSETPGGVAAGYVEDVSRSLTPPAGCQRSPQPKHSPDRLLAPLLRLEEPLARNAADGTLLGRLLADHRVATNRADPDPLALEVLALLDCLERAQVEGMVDLLDRERVPERHRRGLVALL